MLTEMNLSAHKISVSCWWFNQFTTRIINWWRSGKVVENRHPLDSVLLDLSVCIYTKNLIRIRARNRMKCFIMPTLLEICSYCSACLCNKLSTQYPHSFTFMTVFFFLFCFSLNIRIACDFQPYNSTKK